MLLHVTTHKAGFAHGERPKHADFLLYHVGQGNPELRRNVTLRLYWRFSSVSSLRSGSEVATPKSHDILVGNSLLQYFPGDTIGAPLAERKICRFGSGAIRVSNYIDNQSRW